MDKEVLSDVLSEFARTMVTDFPIQGILDHLVERIVDVMPISGAGVSLISQGRDPRYIAASDDVALRFEQLQSELNEGPCVAAYETGEAISVPDIATDGRFPRFGPRASAAGLTGVFTFPLRHGDLRLGALDLYRDCAGPLTPASMVGAQTLADVAAAYLINAQARSDLQDSSDRTRTASLHDPLTGLPNRALLIERLEHAFLRGRRSGNTIAVFFVDLDEFKAINDTYGHKVGDEMLTAVGSRLAGVLRPGDSLARLSGDEFVVLCEDLEDPGQGEAIATRLRDALSPTFALSGEAVNVTASIGIALGGLGDMAPAELIHAADLAMYRGKRERRGGHQVLDLSADHLAGYHAELARDLPAAPGRGELHLAYQPIVDTADGHLTGVEALLRWEHPSNGSVPPPVFIPFAEHSGQIIELGRWVLEQALSDRGQWQRYRDEPIALSVNVSAQEVMSAGFASRVASVLDATSVDPRLLTLEVTEGVFGRDKERALTVLDDLKAEGVNLALDDYGTGDSSLRELKTLPIDTIKVDRSFIASLSDDPDGQSILTAIVQLAHGFGLTVVAEGVETAAQHQQLNSLGSDACQGFYFAHPMPALSLESLIRRRESGRRLLLPTPADASS
ncbi:MAG: hypothetical protein QOD66_3964 [Solirubrobacteraceae bacterium]|jgi:diguanylate cyclase (GGDEF)-like protein|nr:hypothetical protein [Solirubrobacteraceae bacterium]